MKKTFLTVVALVMSLSFVAAQNFVTRIQGFSPKKTSYIELKDGTTIEGKFKNRKIKKGLIKEVKFEVNGEKKSIIGEDIASMRLAPSGLGKLGAMSESLSTVKRAENSDISEINDRDFVHFEQALLPGKKPVYVLLQLVNPGFDSKIKVYDDPRAQETASIGGITGGMLKSYYIVRGGNALRVKKSDYKDLFNEIYGDCAEDIKKDYKKIKFEDFAEHVAKHEQICE